MFIHSVSLTHYHLLKVFIINTDSNDNTVNTTTIPTGIHNGLRTHNQLQLMRLVSFNTMNITNNIPVKFILLSMLFIMIYIFSTRNHYEHRYHNCRSHPHQELLHSIPHQ